jgi:hypothetical protein
MLPVFIDQEYTPQEATEILEAKLVERCQYLKVAGRCDGCAALVECRSKWDGIAGTTEDKMITETEIRIFIARFDRLQASFTLTFDQK